MDFTYGVVPPYLAAQRCYVDKQGNRRSFGGELHDRVHVLLDELKDRTGITKARLVELAIYSIREHPKNVLDAISDEVWYWYSDDSDGRAPPNDSNDAGKAQPDGGSPAAAAGKRKTNRATRGRRAQ